MSHQQRGPQSGQDDRNTKHAPESGNKSNDQNQTRYTIGAEPFINRFIQPRIQYRINNGPPQPGEQQSELIQNQCELFFELHFFF